jgi:hypothetical protein
LTWGAISSFPWAFIDFLLYSASIPFFYFTWAAGYISMLKRASYRNHWGGTLLWPSRYPKRPSEGEDENWL